ncbi:hypothetical protein DYBT9275_02524 [Dyadobacter sp. CECT 9275]|uniref:Uncharacterized protein n=1 Tax=Dyadobacter helix TaxID=2822344 RepID=A0A916NLH0_9BACT|nr:hypothetical protein DYBT9275_02524 [Dyadobacter sp. CECT 9275]
MIKAFPKYFLVLCILLLSTCYCLSSDLHPKYSCCSIENQASLSEYSAYGNAPHHPLLLPKYCTPNFRTTPKIFSKNDEEENFVFSRLRKWAGTSHYFTSFYPTKRRDYFYFPKTLSSARTSCFYTSTDTCILFRVIRI